MAGIILKDPFKPAAHGVIFLDFPDAFGQGRHKGKLYRWSFHDYLGPLFLRKDGEPLVRQPSATSGAWVAFGRWHKARCKQKGHSPSAPQTTMPPAEGGVA